MSTKKPLRAVLMKTIHCLGSTLHKGDIYDIAKFDTSNGNPVVYLNFGQGAIAVMPSMILILAPESKQHKFKNTHQ